MAKRPKAPTGCFWKGGVLWGRVQVGGKDRKWSLHTNDPAVAKARRAEGKGRVVAHVHHGDARLTWEEALAGWMRWIEGEAALSPKTIIRYTVSLGQIDSYLAGKHADEINKRLISTIISARKDAGATNATVKRDLVALSSVCNWLVDEDHIEANPVLPRMKRVKERRDPIILPERAHIEMVIERAPSMIPQMMRAAMVTGCREEELLKAARPDYSRERRELAVIGKRNKRRVISLGHFDGHQVFDALVASPGPRHLFWHGAGEEYANFASNFSALIRRTKAWADRECVHFRPFKFHHLRHWHAVEWLRAGKSLYVLQKRLGHTSLKTTEIYLEFLTPEQQEIVKREVA